MRAAIYCRISRDNEGRELGVTRQHQDCRREAERRGWTVGDLYVDNDLSAYSGKPRPEYRRMLDDVQAGTVGAIVAWHPDRLHRSVRELEDFIDVVAQTGATVATCTAGDYDLSTPDGMFTARILGSVARKESDDKSRRLRRKHLELAEAGKLSGGGHRPFGFEPDRLTVRQAEANLIREAAARILAGESVRGIAADWNATGVSTVTGRPWTQHVLKRLLTSPRVAGLREHRGAVAATAEWPAIVDRSTWDRVRAILNDPRRRTNDGRTARRYLLTGVGTCGLCGAKLVARPRDDGRRCYVCASGPGFSGCGKIRVLADPLEDLVREMIFVALDGPDTSAALAPAAADDEGDRVLREAIREDEEALALLSRDFYSERAITRTEFMANREPLEARIEDGKRRLASLTSQTGVLADLPVGELLRDAWEGRSLDWRRALLKALVEEVRVGPAVRGRNRFDPNRVEAVWRV